MILLFLLFLGPISEGLATCPNTEFCLKRTKQILTDSKRFWFGEFRKRMCSHKNAWSIDCLGPQHISHHHSILSRLFRDDRNDTHLDNLKIFPRAHFPAASGHYRACEHEYFIDNVTAVVTDPDMRPVEPFRVRLRPDIKWDGMEGDHIVMIVDVGFDTLNFLAVDYPRQPVILNEYTPSENFRSHPNPLVILVFRQRSERLIPPRNTEDFDLAHFIKNNRLENDLIGISLFTVKTDGFAIEKQRLKGIVDNCHSLLRDKLLRGSRSKTPILLQLPIDEIDSWISVSFDQQSVTGSVCCQNVHLPRSKVYLDPLGEQFVSAFGTLRPPTVSSMKLGSASNLINYHRKTRNFVELNGKLHSLALVNAATGALHWLLVDITSADLYAATGNGITKATYVPIAPVEANTCEKFIFVLMTQSGSLQNSSNFCETMCEERRYFRISSFNSMKISAISTVNVCYDLPYAHHLLKSHVERFGSTGGETINYKGKSYKSRLAHSELSPEICSRFNVAPHHKCHVGVENYRNGSAANLILLLLAFIFY